MAGQVSIWRWAITEDLEARFARLVAAPEVAFAALAAEIARADDVPSLDDVQARTEARFRAMDVPEDVLETMLEGFRSMMAEAREDEARFAAENEEGDGPDPDGRITVALATSHMFFDDSYKSLTDAEIDRQVAVLVERYRSAASAALKQTGEDLAAYLGITTGERVDDHTHDALMESGLEGVLWVWPRQEGVFFLSQWQEGKELPIDIEFGHAPLAVFDDLKARL